MLGRDPGSLSLAALPFSVGNIISMAYMVLPILSSLSHPERRKEERKRGNAHFEDTTWKSYRSVCSQFFSQNLVTWLSLITIKIKKSVL